MATIAQAHTNQPKESRRQPGQSPRAKRSQNWLGLLGWLLGFEKKGKVCVCFIFNTLCEPRPPLEQGVVNGHDTERHEAPEHCQETGLKILQKKAAFCCLFLASFLHCFVWSLGTPNAASSPPESSLDSSACPRAKHRRKACGITS